MANNPYFDSDGWYWWDETSDIYGPYDTQAEAQIELSKYILWLETGETDA